MSGRTGKIERMDTEEFSRFTEGLDYSMYVVTAAGPGGPAGCLVGFATQVSIDPPRLLVCLSVRNHTFAVAQDADRLAVHALGRDQGDLARLFGSQTGDDIDKFAQCRWHRDTEGVPLLDDVAQRLVGRVLATHPFGDHVGFVLEPVAVAVGDGRPALAYSQVSDLDPGHDA